MNHRLFTRFGILGLSAFILLGCETNKVSLEQESLPFEQIAVLGQPPFLDAENIVIRDESTWKSLWPAQRPIVKEAPSVDFNQKMVLGINLGQHPDLAVPELAVRWIRKRTDPDRIEVAYLVTKPEPRWGVGGQGTRVQYKFVSTSRSDLPVEFVQVRSNTATLHNEPMNTGDSAADYPKR
jgi:hypothetical protein